MPLLFFGTVPLILQNPSTGECLRVQGSRLDLTLFGLDVPVVGTLRVYLCSVKNKDIAKMKTNSNPQVSVSDQIVAQLEMNGRVLARVNNRNFHNIDEVVGMIQALAGKFLGLASLTIRNQTQGWSKVMMLATRHCAAPAYSRPSAPVMHGRQYVIPF